MSELKPCPFCGGSGLPHRVPTGWRVSCKVCQVQPRFSFPADTEAEAIAAWNHRTPAPASADAMEVWKAANEACDEDMGDLADGYQAAARIIQQHGDKCRAEERTLMLGESCGAYDARREAAGFRRGVEAAVKVAQDARDAWAASHAMYYGDVMEASAQAAHTILENTRAILDKEAG